LRLTVSFPSALLEARRTFAGEIATSAMRKRTYTGAADVRPPCGLENPLAKPIRLFLFNEDHRRSTGTSAHAGDDTATATAFVAAPSGVCRALVDALARVRYSKHGGRLPVKLRLLRCTNAHTRAADVRPPWERFELHRSGQAKLSANTARVILQVLVAEEVMVVLGEPMGFVADILQQPQRRRGPAEP